MPTPSSSKRLINVPELRCPIPQAASFRTHRRRRISQSGQMSELHKTLYAPRIFGFKIEVHNDAHGGVKRVLGRIVDITKTLELSCDKESVDNDAQKESVDEDHDNERYSRIKMYRDKFHSFFEILDAAIKDCDGRRAPFLREPEGFRLLNYFAEQAREPKSKRRALDRAEDYNILIGLDDLFRELLNVPDRYHYNHVLHDVIGILRTFVDTLTHQLPEAYEEEDFIPWWDVEEDIKRRQQSTSYSSTLWI
jgi:hypothetical protein